MKVNLEDQLKMAEATLKNIRQIKEEKKDVTIQEKGKMVEYQEAKDDYLLQISLLQKMVEEQERARLISTNPPISIHERATEAPKYTKPNVGLQLGLSSLSAILGGICVGIGRRLRRTAVRSK
jgi:hypothetical protein